MIVIAIFAILLLGGIVLGLNEAQQCNNEGGTWIGGINRNSFCAEAERSVDLHP